MKRISENIKLILSVLALFGVFSGGATYVYSMEQKVDKNTQYRLEEQYGRVWDRVDRIEAKCGEQAIECGERDKKDYRFWSIKMEELKKELGY